MANFDHTACYRDGLHPPTKAGRQQCPTSGPASRMDTGTDPQIPAASPPAAPRDESAAAEVRRRRAAVRTE